MSAATNRTGKAGEPARTVGTRRRLLLSSLIAASLLMAYRAFSLQVLQAEDWRAKAEKQQADDAALPAPRGTIYDRDGIPLAASHEVYRINLAPKEITQRDRLVELLQQHAGL